MKHLDWKRIWHRFSEYMMAFYFVYKMLRDYPKVEKELDKLYFHNGEEEK
jgi:hypothetical protein